MSHVFSWNHRAFPKILDFSYFVALLFEADERKDGGYTEKKN